MVPYLYVSRYCAKACEEGEEPYYTNTLKKTCCRSDFCNAATTTHAVTMTTMMMAAAATVVMTVGITGMY